MRFRTRLALVGSFASLSLACATGGSTDGFLDTPGDSGKKDSSSGDSTGEDTTGDPKDTAPSSDSADAAVDTAKCDPPSKICGGACVDPATDPDNCGACGTKCTSGETCTAGVCTCKGSATKCSGLCIDTSVDTANCGTCGKSCLVGEVCVGGKCACPTGETSCFGICVDTATDPKNCGVCSNVCPSGKCVASKCTCPSPTTDCSGTCVDTSSDSKNCGTCGKTCATTETCTAGACVCKSGLTKCGSSCVDLLSDSSNCGTCGKTCTTGTACVSGTCGTKCNSGTFKVLIYGSTGSTESPYVPTGSVTTVATDTTWKAMTTADFKSYQLIIIGNDGSVYTSGTPLQAAYDTRATWGPAVTGRVVVTTLDPTLHTVAGAGTFLRAALKWAASGPGTGLYVGPDYGRRKLDFMSTFGAWTVLGQATDSVQGDPVHINLTSHGTMIGSSDASLSTWGYSYHGAVTAFPTGFQSVAAATSPTTYGVVVAKDVTCTP